MRKLRLVIDDLAVDSFDTHAGPTGRGTLFGRSGPVPWNPTEHTVCWGVTCPDCGDTALAFCTQGCGGDTADGCGGGSGNTCGCPNTGETACAECGSTAPLCTAPEGGC